MIEPSPAEIALAIAKAPERVNDPESPRWSEWSGSSRSVLV